MTQLHVCPWPDCTRTVPDPHWGCVSHWNYIPRNLQVAWKTHFRYGLKPEQQTEDGRIAAANLSRWVIDNAPAIMGGLGMALRASDRTDFAAGITTDGRVFLLWPNRGEFFTLTKEESGLIVRAIRAQLLRDEA